jgi:hypothetical protein
VATSSSIKATRRGFKGVVNSTNKRCEQGRKITLKKKKDGPDATAGTGKSNDQGAWKVREPRANGRYYVLVAKKVFTSGNGNRVVCKPGRSRAVKGR